jgi:hypothetical protein
MGGLREHKKAVRLLADVPPLPGYPGDSNTGLSSGTVGQTAKGAEVARRMRCRSADKPGARPAKGIPATQFRRLSLSVFDPKAIKGGLARGRIRNSSPVVENLFRSTRQ